MSHNVAKHLNDEDWDTDIQEDGRLGGIENHTIADYGDAMIRHRSIEKVCFIKNYPRLSGIIRCLNKNIYPLK